MKNCFLSYFIIVLLLGCSTNKNLNKESFSPLKATFSRYHSAMGSGKGIIFRIDSINNIINNYTIDSFYLNGKPMKFEIIKSENETFLEANYYIPSVLPEFNGEPINNKTSAIKQITDTIIVAHTFYPSWLIISNKLIKKRIDITIYKEIIAETKY